MLYPNRHTRGYLGSCLHFFWFQVQYEKLHHISVWVFLTHLLLVTPIELWDLWFVWVYSHSPGRHSLYQFYTWGSLYSSRRALLSLSNSCMRSPWLWGSFQKLKLSSRVFCAHMEDSKSVHVSPGGVLWLWPRGVMFSGGRSAFLVNAMLQSQC